MNIRRFESKFLSAVLVAGVSCFFSLAQAREISVELPAVKIPVVKAKNERVVGVALRFSCSRTASLWEFLNNGADNWEDCDKFDYHIDSLGDFNRDYRGDIFVPQEEDGVSLPKISIKYDNRRSGTACIRLVPVSGVRESTFSPGNINLDTVDSEDWVRVCSRAKLPKFLTGETVPSFNQWSEFLSKPIEFK